MMQKTELFAANNDELRAKTLTRVEGVLLKSYLHHEKLVKAKTEDILNSYQTLDYIAIRNLKGQLAGIVKEKKRIATAFRSLTCQDIESYLGG